jgi:hypothetical protein
MKRRSLLSGIAALPIMASIPAIATPRHETVVLYGSTTIGVSGGDYPRSFGVTISTDTEEATQRILELSETALPGDTVTVMLEFNGKQSLVGTYTA